MTEAIIYPSGDESWEIEESSLDAARKAAATASFFMAFALVIGVFIADAAGALGGHHRDEF
jgi:hypothetical protein